MIFAELECPTTKETKNREIQIKWRELRDLKRYVIGDMLDDLFPEYINNWVKTDYVCESCSKLTKGDFGNFVRVEDQQRHYCFIRVENSRIIEVLSEEKFAARGIEDYILYE